jgi:hypothetical protein
MTKKKTTEKKPKATEPKAKKPLREVAIVHYNTPELTEAAILSLRKHGGENYNVTVFDNSTERPFTAKMKGVKILDNTQGKIINFDKFLADYPERNESIGCAGTCIFGSAKHMRTVQELWKLLPKGFLLMESDILLKADIDFMFMEDQAVCGHVQWEQPGNPYHIGRLMPLLCWMNVPVLVKAGAKYFDPERTYGLMAERNNPKNWYDTGAALLEDVRTMKPQLHGKGIDIRPLMEHYQSASWKRSDINEQTAWLDAHKDLWA